MPRPFPVQRALKFPPFPLLSKAYKTPANAQGSPFRFPLCSSTNSPFVCLDSVDLLRCRVQLRRGIAAASNRPTAGRRFPKVPHVQEVVPDVSFVFTEPRSASPLLPVPHRRLYLAARRLLRCPVSTALLSGFPIAPALGSTPASLLQPAGAPATAVPSCCRAVAQPLPCPCAAAAPLCPAPCRGRTLANPVEPCRSLPCLAGPLPRPAATNRALPRLAAALPRSAAPLPHPAAAAQFQPYGRIVARPYLSNRNSDCVDSFCVVIMFK